MKKAVLLVFIMVSLVVTGCTKQKEAKSGIVVAKVGSETITQNDIAMELKTLPEQIQGIFKGPEGTAKFVDELVKREILYQEAKKKGLEDNADYKKKVEDFKKITIISTLLEKEVEEKAKVTEEDTKNYYEKHKDEFVANSQIRASHILVKSEDEAKKILEELKKGGNFAKLAKAKSTDPGSAKNGGDLGLFSKGQMVPEFENAAFSAKAGELTGPVKTQFGYHIIKVLEKKEGTPVEFEKIKKLLTQRLTGEKQKEVFDSYINNLKGSYKVEVDKAAIAKITTEGDTQKGSAEEKPLQKDVKPEQKPEEKKADEKKQPEVKK